MDQPFTDTLVSTEWLAAHLSDPNLRILDGSWHLPTDNRNALAEYKAAHIPRAQFFDIDAVSDQASDLPHMLPSADQFAQAVAALDISNENQIVVYDTQGLFSAARVWWMFRFFGMNKVAVLNGGFLKWKAEGRPTETKSAPPSNTKFTAHPIGAVRTASDVLAASQSGNIQILDARAPERFNGTAPEPRAGLRSGHIPGSINIFYKALLNEDGTLKPDEDLKEVFETQGVDLDRPIITSCGSGVTACVLLLALHKIGHRDNALYDGSWVDWGAQPDLPIETG